MMIDKVIKGFSKDAARALVNGDVRPNIGGTSLKVGMTITIPADAVIDCGKIITSDKEEKKFLFIKGTNPMLTLSTLLATPPTEARYAKWNKIEGSDLPSLDTILAAAESSYQPTSRNIEKFAELDFPYLLGKTLEVTSRTDFRYGSNDFDSKYITFKVKTTAAKNNDKKK